MEKIIWLDMDGTFVDLYGVSNWLDKLINENAEPYEIAKPLFNMQVFARLLNRKIKQGYQVNIISWLSKNASDEYAEKVYRAKMAWLDKHLKSVEFNRVDIVEYGKPKNQGRQGILFDDEIQNRKNWNGLAFEPKNIIEILKSL